MLLIMVIGVVEAGVDYGKLLEKNGELETNQYSF